MSQKLTSWLLEHYGKENYHPGLNRIKGALGPLTSSLQKSKIITIAGTNGKGETTLRLSELLKNHTHCVWTSPHVLRLNERFRSEKGEISDQELENQIFSSHEIVQGKLTYYEFLFFAFCRWAQQMSPEFILLEVGLGGRLDAVNAFDADLVLLPSISRDHQEYLGNRYELILKEKLGVLRPHSFFINFLGSKYLREKARAFGARGIDLAEQSDLPEYKFSERNQLLAYAAYLHLMKLPIDVKNWRPKGDALENRGEKILQGAEWSLYGSHNVDGMRKLIQFLRSENYTFSSNTFDAVIIAFSQRDPRDLKVMLKMMKAANLGRILVTIFDHPKAATLECMKTLASQEGLEFVQNIDSYVEGRKGAHARRDKILVAGSYYFLGHIKSLLGRR